MVYKLCDRCNRPFTASKQNYIKKRVYCNKCLVVIEKINKFNFKTLKERIKNNLEV